MSPLEHYLETNYTLCPKPKMFQDLGLYFTMLHVITVLTFLTGLYSCFVIIQVTPKKMGVVKYPMLLVQLACLHLDATLEFIVMGAMYLPIPAISLHGVLSWLGVPFRWQGFYQQYSIYLVGLSITALFQNRHTAISTAPYRLTCPVSIAFYHLFSCAFGVITLSVMYLENVDQTVFKWKYLEVYKCPPIEYFTDGAILSSNPLVAATCLGLVVVYAVLNGAFFPIASLYHLVFLVSRQVSKKTRVMQLKFLATLLIQIAIPLITLIVPSIFYVLTILYDINDQRINNLGVLMMATHGIISNIYLYTITFCNSKLRDIHKELSRIYYSSTDNYENLTVLCETWKNCTQSVCEPMRATLKYVEETCEFLKFFVSPDFMDCLEKLQKTPTTCLNNYLLAPKLDRRQKCEVFKNECMEHEILLQCTEQIAKRFGKSQKLRINLEKCE